jgi:rhodanese-related sulfurtransferase
MGFFKSMFGAPANAAAHISSADYKSRYFDGQAQHILVDVRTPEEFRAGYIPGAKNIPLQDLGRLMNTLPRDIPVILYCRSGSRSASAAGMLKQAGFDKVYDLGGIFSWASSGYPIKQAGR